MRASLLAVTLLTCIQSILHANFFEKPNVDSNMGKIYVEAKDITLTHDGIYWDFEGVRIPLKSVQADGAGLFITPKNNNDIKYMRYTCPGCKQTYAWYENCRTKGCPYNTYRE